MKPHTPTIPKARKKGGGCSKYRARGSESDAPRASYTKGGHNLRFPLRIVQLGRITIVDIVQRRFCREARHIHCLHFFPYICRSRCAPSSVIQSRFSDTLFNSIRFNPPPRWRVDKWWNSGWRIFNSTKAITDRTCITRSPRPPAVLLAVLKNVITIPAKRDRRNNTICL